MSLYEKYFSKINEEHMFKMIKKIILEDTGINIETNDVSKMIFKERYPLIFEENNVESLIELNKLLIDDICLKIINQNISQKTYQVNNQVNNPPNNVLSQQKMEIIPESELFIIKSSKRKKSSINRFNYSIHSDNCKLQINKIVIPFENNDIFINDNLLLKINNTDIYCQLKSKNKIENREYFTYEPYNKKKIDIEEDINIKLMNELEIEKSEKDIYLIHQFKNIKLKEKEYLCISSEGIQDIELNDKIGLIENDEIKDIVRIIHIANNFLLCDKKDISFDSIINLSLQNTIYCDIS